MTALRARCRWQGSGCVIFLSLWIKHECPSCFLNKKNFKLLWRLNEARRSEWTQHPSILHKSSYNACCERKCYFVVISSGTGLMESVIHQSKERPECGIGLLSKASFVRNFRVSFLLNEDLIRMFWYLLRIDFSEFAQAYFFFCLIPIY